MSNKLAEENKLLKEMIVLLKEYNRLFGFECNELTTLAMTHGWKSSRVEAGVDVRSRIAKKEEELKAYE